MTFSTTPRPRIPRSPLTGGAILLAGLSSLPAAGMERPATAYPLPLRVPEAATGSRAQSPTPLRPGAAPEDTIQEPADTFRDPGVRELILQARKARQREVEGIRNYEARLQQRAYLGLRGVGFRRERGLLDEERVARVRWERGGDAVVSWTGGRREVPIIGAVGGAEDELQASLARDLLRGVDPGPVLNDPGDDRLIFGGGGNWALHPLADSAGLHYRFASGDTLTLRLPDGRTVTLVEAEVQPRTPRFNLVAGSLWFDRDQGGLVRATYRPARPFDLELDEPENAADIPGIFKPVRAEIRYITVDHSFHEFRWWLPARFAFEGEVQLGRLVRFPITLEWRMDDYEVNVEQSSLPGLDRLPAGWSRTQRVVRRPGEDPRYLTVLVPPGERLLRSPDLTPGVGGASPVGFSESEVREILGRLDGLLPRDLRLAPSAGWGFQEGLVRYNRVEGLSVGARGRVPLSPRDRLQAEVRLGTADLEPNGELALIRESGDDRRTSLAAYRRLVSSDDRLDPFGLGASLSGVLWGGDHAPYHRTLGAEVAILRTRRWARFEGRVFGEEQTAPRRETHFHLLRPVNGRDMQEVQPVEEGRLAGVAAMARGQRGLDPGGLIATGTLQGEAAVGDFSFQRLSAAVSVVHPLPGGLAGAVEVLGGRSWGRPPPQRQFFLGGVGSVRGFRPAERTGDAFWAARMELGNALPGVRLTIFGDLGWAGPVEESWRGVPIAAAGGGLSFLDGLLRADLARAVRGGRGYRLHLYLDALF